MRKIRWFVIPFLMFTIMACSIFSGIQNVQSIKNTVSTQLPDIQNAVSTQIPDLLTSVPTAQGFMETAAAAVPTSQCSGTPQSGGLGITMDTARAVLQVMQQFTLTDGTSNGQPSVDVTLNSQGASSFPAVADGFKAQFIGDVCNLSEITVTIPRTDQQDTVDQGTNLLTIVLSGSLPIDVQLQFLSWASQNYQGMAVSDQQQTTINNMQFTLVRNQDTMVLDILPAQ